MKFSKRRYRSNVTVSKWVVAIVFLLLATWTTISLIMPDLAHDSTPTKTLAAKHEVEISAPVFEGFDKNGKSYQLASKSLTKIDKNFYDLDKVDGKYNLGWGDVDLSASKGTVNEGGKLLYLLNDIVIAYSEYLIKTNQMDIDFTTMSAKNNNEVNVLYRNSDIKADKFSADSDSDIIHFEGNVITHFKVSDF